MDSMSPTSRKEISSSSLNSVSSPSSSSSSTAAIASPSHVYGTFKSNNQLNQLSQLCPLSSILGLNGVTVDIPVPSAQLSSSALLLQSTQLTTLPTSHPNSILAAGVGPATAALSATGVVSTTIDHHHIASDSDASSNVDDPTSPFDGKSLNHHNNNNQRNCLGIPFNCATTPSSEDQSLERVRLTRVTPRPLSLDERTPSQSQPDIIIAARRKSSFNNTKSRNNSNDWSLFSLIMNLIKGFVRFGLLSALVSSLFSAFIPIIVIILHQTMTHHIHPLLIVVIQSVIHLAIYLLVGIITDKAFFGPREEILYLLLYGLLMSAAVPLAYISFIMIPVGDAHAIAFAAPVFVLVLEWLMLRRRGVSLYLIFDILFTCIGIAFIVFESIDFLGFKQARDTSKVIVPEFHTKKNWLGICVACGAAGIVALASLTSLKLQKMSRIVINCWTAALQAIICLSIGFSIGKFQSWPNDPKEICMLIALGVCQPLSQLFFSLAFKLEKSTGQITFAKAAQVLFVYLFQITMASQPLSWLSVNAALIVTACSVTAVYLRYYEDKATDSPVKYVPLWVT